jgi:membrane protein
MRPFTGLAANHGMVRRAGASGPRTEIWMFSFFRKTYRVFSIGISHFVADDGWAMASHLALSALMAIFPFLIFVAALAAFVGQRELADTVTDLIFQAWPPDIAEPIANEVHKVLTEPRGGILTVSVVITIYLASNGVEAVRMALNRAYRSTETRSIFFLRFQSVGYVIIGALTSLALAILGVLGPLLWSLLEGQFEWLRPFRAGFEIVRYVVVGGLLLVALVAAHLWLPRQHPPGLRLWPGITATLVLWWVVTAAFARYLESFANYTATYAGLATVVAAIFYLYLMAVILIAGAEFNAAIAAVREESAAKARGTGETAGEWR